MAPQSDPIVVTGMGAVSPLGVGVGITLALLVTGGWAPRLESWLGWK